jgi:hypothetical protein
MVRHYGLVDAKPSNIPMEPNTVYSVEQGPQTPQERAEMRRVPYREAVGSLMYAAIGTRPDIAFATSILAQFFENPGNAHWEAAKRVIRYLKGTAHWRLTYSPETHALVGYSDADGNSQPGRKAISGYAFLLDGGAFSWSTKKQELVSTSTTESEYIAASYAAKEALTEGSTMVAENGERGERG